MSNFITKPLISLQQQVSRLPIWIHIIIAVCAFALYRVTNIILDASYAQSQFPVPFYAGQTTFNGEVLKSYYQHMLDAGTFDIYWRTQFIDFTFIASLFAAGIIIPALLRRIALPAGWGDKLLTLAGILIPLGAIFDAIENLNSFILMAQPQTFANWLALPYSTFAAIKFGCIGLGFITLLIGLVVALLERGWRWIRPTQMALS